jgi:hypothetical protein
MESHRVEGAERSIPTKRAGRLDAEYFEENDVSEDDVDRGAIIGVVELVECTKKRTGDWHFRGNWGWYLARPRRFKKPIPMKGRLGLYEVPDRKVGPQLPKHLQSQSGKYSKRSEDSSPRRSRARKWSRRRS